MKILQWAIDRLIPYARNARKIPQEAIDKVAASIKEFGWQQPIVLDSERVVVAGHVRLLAAKQLGLEKVPVLVATDLTPSQITGLLLAFTNPLRSQAVIWLHSVVCEAASGCPPALIRCSQALSIRYP